MLQSSQVITRMKNYVVLSAFVLVGALPVLAEDSTAPQAPVQAKPLSSPAPAAAPAAAGAHAGHKDGATETAIKPHKRKKKAKKSAHASHPDFVATPLHDEEARVRRVEPAPTREYVTERDPVADVAEVLLRTAYVASLYEDYDPYDAPYPYYRPYYGGYDAPSFYGGFGFGRGFHGGYRGGYGYRGFGGFRGGFGGFRGGFGGRGFRRR